MSFTRVLIANRGEIAVRIARAAAEAGIESVAVFATDDAGNPHVAAADRAVALSGAGARAYLDIPAIVAAARAEACDALHPGYGFLSENPALARACADAGIVFIGPSPEHLEVFGDKAAARALAAERSAPLIPGTGALDLDAARAFQAEHGAIMLKARAGGGGRGMRAVLDPGELDAAYAACEREALAAFGDGGLYAETLLTHARHIEVQIVGDGIHALAVGDRDCSLQRRNQKLVEIAPAVLPDLARAELWRHAEALCAGYQGLATVEFLLDAETGEAFFLEVNPRLQVEHTVTEEVTGLDLVRLQFDLAAGASLERLGLTAAPPASGVAIQARVNAETLTADGQVKPSSGTISAWSPPGGPGVRIDAAGAVGLVVGGAYDSLLAKVIARGRTATEATARLDRALAEFTIGGVATTAPLVRAILAAAPEAPTTRFIEDHAAVLAAGLPSTSEGDARIFETLDGAIAVAAPLSATVGSIAVAEGDLVRPGQALAVLEAMKMEHLVHAERGGRVLKIAAAPGANVAEGQPLVFLEPVELEGADTVEAAAEDLDAIRPDLAEVIARHRFTLDEARPDAVAKRRKTGHRTARENIDDLVDPGSFLEYGALAIAAQKRRRSTDDLIASTPADGLITGIGTVNGGLFPPDKARTAALAYDFTVLAGTQGAMNHKKSDRLMAVIADQRLPVVWFAEGGGGRPGDTDTTAVAGLDVPTFRSFAQLSGLVPKIAIVAGRCFAGNAAIAGLSEMIIATRDSNLGMGGPAMIAGGGLGVFRPEEIGPSAHQWRNGVIDILADDEAQATRLAKQALSYFQGSLTSWTVPDQRRLRGAIPENRLRVYDVRALIKGLVDEDSFLELRGGFAAGMVTGLIRIEGRPMGLIANDPRHLGGAIDCEGAEKAARFLQLCDAFALPVVSLCDTPGFMVGPASEDAAAVRRVSRQFIAGAKLRSPLFTVVTRKGYGLGAQAMAGGSFHSPAFIAAWPTGEFGGMGLEGAVQLGYRKELEAETDPVKQKALYDQLVARLYAAGKATSMAAALEIDAVIDPADTRRWIMGGLDAAVGMSRPWEVRVDSF
ncbi:MULTISPECIES: carboxyl transferase domain-containing protein [unclassified Caulobacter]|uniref:acetyl-CoA carboxylase family protein n=1 Tax=unclassified Caulobacter TaxID=2648921 RepID=UPI0006F58F41|nr:MULTISPECIES: carboxyl transferase domain-containing protein [unclassified Caulobacter]KQV62828.1 carbamoyl-phosphate synthase large subunit [Caulobacter sp. Root342]KQV71961.1 carbamoyl-phosphate synthase large subunit [Caulobacter sp. Root343]